MIMLQPEQVEEHLLLQERAIAALQATLAMSCLKALRRGAVRKLIFHVMMNGVLVYIIAQQPGWQWIALCAALMPYHFFHGLKAVRQLVITGRLEHGDKLPPALQHHSILQAIIMLEAVSRENPGKHLRDAASYLSPASFVQPAKNL